MKTVYAACLSRLGLSQPDAASLHNVRLDTVKSWSSGRNPVPSGVWDDLRAYEARLLDASGTMRQAWVKAGKPTIEINDTEGNSWSLVVAADLILTTDSPVKIGESEATKVARQARRPN